MEALKLRDSQPLSAVGLVQAACMDGTDLKAWSSRSLDDNKRGRGDPDARLGRGGKGFYSATGPSSSPTSKDSPWATWRPLRT